LALALGRTVGEIECTMTAQELERWRIFIARHPFPADIIDTHCAMLATLMANYARADGQPPFTIEQFFVIRGAPPPAETPQPTSEPTGLSEAERVLMASGLR
jgi:hypothetical protein